MTASFAVTAALQDLPEPRRTVYGVMHVPGLALLTLPPLPDRTIQRPAMLSSSSSRENTKPSARLTRALLQELLSRTYTLATTATGTPIPLLARLWRWFQGLQGFLNSVS